MLFQETVEVKPVGRILLLPVFIVILGRVIVFPMKRVYV